MPIKTLGDPHLGRKFVNGVPLERRGEREDMVWAQFEAELANLQDGDIHVCMGDIFDKFIVAPETVLRAAAAYLGSNPLATKVILRGNHDASRDVDKRSSFDLLKMLLGDKVHVVTEPITIGDYAFCPWHPFKTAAEIVEELPERRFEAIFGHWDLESYGSEEPNLVPVEALLKRTPVAVTGHYHIACTKAYGDLDLICTGSMQPYTHGEDPEETLYVTRTPEQVLSGDEDYTNKCLRIRCAPGEAVPLEAFNCLQLTVQRINPEASEVEEVNIDDFDMNSLFSAVFTEFGINPVYTQKYQELYLERRNS